MPKAKQSFFQRLTGAVDVDDTYDEARYEEETPTRRGQVSRYEDEAPMTQNGRHEEGWSDDDVEGQLTVCLLYTSRCV